MGTNEILDDLFGPTSTTATEEKKPPAVRKTPTENVLDELFPSEPTTEPVTEPTPIEPIEPEPELEPITPELPPEPKPQPTPQSVTEPVTPPPVPSPTIPQPRGQEIQPAVTSTVPELEAPKAAPSKGKWGKLPINHPDRHGYIEMRPVNGKTSLFPVLIEDPDFEGWIEKPEGFGSQFYRTLTITSDGSPVLVPAYNKSPEPSAQEPSGEVPPAKPPKTMTFEPEVISGKIPSEEISVEQEGPEISPPVGEVPREGQLGFTRAKKERPEEGKEETRRPIAIPIIKNDKVILIPTVRRGLDRIMSNEEAIDWYRKTQKHYGEFDNLDSAIAQLKKLSELPESTKPEAGVSAIPTAMPSYGQRTYPIQTAQPKAKKPPTMPPESTDMGNIDLANRPEIKNEDGTLSTIRSLSINEDGKEVLIPTVREDLDREMSDKEAIEWYHQTGEYLGKFNTVKEADEYAKELSKGQYARLLSDKRPTAEPQPKIEIPPAMPGYGQFAQPVPIIEPKPGEKMGTPEAMARSFAGGAAELALNFARTPQTAAEVYLALNNYTNRALNYGLKKVTGKEKGPLPEIPLKSIPNIIKLDENAWDTKAFRNFAEKQKEAINEATDSKGVLDNLAAGDFAKAGKSVGIQVAAQIPLMLSMLGGGAAGMGAKALGGLAGVTQTSDQMSQYWKDVEAGVAKQTPEKAAVNSFVNGAIEYLGERYVTGNIIEGMFKEIKKRTSEEVAKKAVGEAVGSVVGEIIKNSGQEFTEETIVNYSQAVMDNLLGKEDITWKEAIKKGIEGGIIGFFTSIGTTGSIKAATQPRRTEGQITEMVDEKTGKVTPLEKGAVKAVAPPPQGQLTEIVDEKTGETRPLGEIPGEIKSIEELEQQAKEKITPKPKEAKRGLQGETETKIEKKAELPSGETVTEPVTKQPVLATPSKKEKPSAKETGKAVGETGSEEGPIRGKEGRIRVRDYEKGGLETKTGKEIKTPKGVIAEVKPISKKTNLNNEKAYEPVLDLNKNPTGWMRPKNNKSVLIDPVNRKQVIFKAENPEAATAKAKTNTAASGYAMNNPIETAPKPKEKPSEPTGKVSRKAPVSPAKSTEGEVPKTKEKKEKVSEKEKPIVTTPEEEYDIIDGSGEVTAKGYSGAQSNEAMGLSLEDVDTGKKPISKHTISQKLSELGKIPVRVGRYNRKRALGIFKVRPREIRVSEAGNIPVIAHEVGHSLERDVLEDMKFNSRWSKIRKELTVLGKALYGKNRPANGYASEGWAEYWNYYFAKGSEIEKLAPVTHDYVENTFFKDNPKFQKKVDEIKDLVEGYKKQGSIKRAEAQIVPEKITSSIKQAVKAINKENLVEEAAGIESAVDRMNAIKSENIEVYETRLQKLEDWKNNELKQKPSPSEEKRILKKYDRFKAKYQKAIDDNRSELTTSKDPYKAVQALRRTGPALVKYMAERGMLDFNRRVVGRPLSDAANIVRKYKNGRGAFKVYLYSRRAQEYHRLGLDPGLDLTDANNNVEQYEKKYPDFAIAAKIVHDWNRGILDFANQAGAIPDDVVAKIKNKWDFYFPFERVYEPTSMSRGKGSKIVEKAKGSGLAIRDPFETMLKKAERIVDLTHRRYILDRLFELNNVEGIGEIMVEVPRDKVPNTFPVSQIKSQLEEKGVNLDDVDLEEMITTFTPSKRAPSGEPIIAKVVNEKVKKIVDGEEKLVGQEKIKWYYVDENLYKAIDGMNKVNTLNPLVDFFLGKPSRLFKMGTTGVRASFSLSNAAKDLGVAMVQSSGKKNPKNLLGYVGNTIKSDFNKLLETAGAKPSEFNDLFNRLGLEMSQPLGIDIKHTRRAEKALFRGKVEKIVKNPVDALRDIIQITEGGPRVAAIMKMVKERGIDINNMTTDQMFDLIIEGSQVTTDFRAVGKLVRNWNLISPFLNANIQGKRQFLRTWKKDPKSAIAVGLVSMTLPSIINWFLNKDEDWYKELPENEKYLYENVAIGDNVLRVPRAHEWGLVFQTLPVMMIDAAYKKDPEGVLELVRNIIGSEAPNMTPHTFQILKEQWRNKVDFTGRRIVSKAVEDKPGPEQYGPYTSNISIGIANMFKELNWSPDRIDHIIRNTFGGVGQDILSVTRNEKSTVKELANIPVVGRFFRWGGKYSFRNKSIDEFYDLYNKYFKLANSKEYKDNQLVKITLRDIQTANKDLKIFREAYKAAEAKKERQKIAKSTTDTVKVFVERIQKIEDYRIGQTKK